MSDEIVELDLGVVPEAGVSAAVCLRTEDRTFLMFRALRLSDMENTVTAVVEFKRCLLTRFGYPNDEARFSIPRFQGADYNISEVRNSSWI